MNKLYYIVLSWNYKNQQDQQNFDLAPMRYRSKSAAALCAQETVNAELNLWTLSVADGSKPWTFRAEVVECAA